MYDIILSQIFSLVFLLQPISYIFFQQHLCAIFCFFLFYYYFSDYYQEIRKKWYYIVLMLVINIFIGLIFNFIIHGKLVARIDICIKRFYLATLPNAIMCLLTNLVFLLTCFVYKKEIDNEKNINNDIDNNLSKKYHYNNFLTLPTIFLISAGAIFAQTFFINYFIVFTTILFIKSRNLKKSMIYGLIFSNFFHLLIFIFSFFSPSNLVFDKSYTLIAMIISLPITWISIKVFKKELKILIIYWCFIVTTQILHLINMISAL